MQTSEKMKEKITCLFNNFNYPNFCSCLFSVWRLNQELKAHYNMMKKKQVNS